jgi:hypothetical protein
MLKGFAFSRSLCVPGDSIVFVRVAHRYTVRGRIPS